ncbi:MAG: TnpV protein [Oscillospiraceae bacterium]|nr:TnpV protein [Oscillospiraceae bacterium]
MEITYTKHGDYLLPDLVAPEGIITPLGKYGRLRMDYLKQNRRALYLSLKSTCKLNEHLADVDSQACEMVEVLTSQMAKAEGVTEALKVSDQMAWVGAMNNIRSRAEEIALKEIVYC